MNRILVLTVGLGDPTQLEETLFAPLRKSVRSGDWERVILLPSQMTSGRAEEFASSLGGAAVEVHTLPRTGLENDADVCFAHFDAVLAALLAGGAPASAITVDFTRGTKAMSAAAVLAAVGREVKCLRYIEGERDQRGTVLPGTERIRDVSPALATVRRDLERAAQFLDRLQFGAVEQLLGKDAEGSAGAYAAEREWAVWLAQFWGAWDRFDYPAAAALLGARPQPAAPPGWARFRPRDGNAALASGLAAAPPTSMPAKAKYTRDLVADLLANARRRLRLGQHEDTLLRAYRVLELMGQARLYDHELESDKIDQAHPGFVKFREEKVRKKEALVPDRRGEISLGRENVARLLKSMEDGLGKKLLAAVEFKGIKERNHSLLIHGFEAHSAAAPVADLEAMLDSLERLFHEENPANGDRMEAARFPFGG